MVDQRKICPRCDFRLTHRQSKEVEAFFCPECGGVWLDRDLAFRFFEAVEEERKEIKVSQAAYDISWVADHSTQKKEYKRIKDLPCVICAKAMTQESISNVGFEVDICYEHGVFFDRGELSSLTQSLGAQDLSKFSKQEKHVYRKTEPGEIIVKIISFFIWDRFYGKDR